MFRGAGDRVPATGAASRRATHSAARDAANVVNRVAGGSRLVERRPAALHAGRREGVPCGTNVMTSKYAWSRVLSMLDWCRSIGVVLDWCRGAGQRATAASELRAGDVNARRPRGTRGRSAAMGAESVDVAEHSATLDQRDGRRSVCRLCRRPARRAARRAHASIEPRRAVSPKPACDPLGIATDMRASSSCRSR